MGITSLRFFLSPFYYAWSFGLPLVALALVLGLGAGWMYELLPPELFPDFYDYFLPRATFGLSILSIVFAHFSYNRIHHPKLFFLLYLAGFSYLWQWGLVTWDSGFKVLYLEQNGAMLSGILLILSQFFPSRLNYSLLKKLTWFSSAFYGVSLYLVTLYMAPGGPVLLLNIEMWHGAALAAVGVCTVFGLLRLSRQFFLPGIILGFLFLCYGQMTGNEWLADYSQLKDFWKLSLPVFAIFGTFAHWLYKISHNIRYDPLMGVYNRAYCNMIISGQSSLKTGPPFSVAMIDIDHFKKVNDTHGHQAGDAVLANVAQTIKRQLGGRGVLCRYGGEEMIVFLPKLNGKQSIQVLESVRLAVKKLRVNQGKKKLKVTVSSGIAQRTNKGQDIEELIAIADKAVYKAKKNGRDRVVLGKTATRR